MSLDTVRGSVPLAPAVVTVVLAVLVGGVPGGLIVLTAAIETAPGRRRAPAGVALGLLVLAALATVLEAPLAVSAIGLDYALDRPLADAAGRLAGVALLVAVAVAAIAERASPGTDHTGGGWRPVALTGPGRRGPSRQRHVAARARAALPYAVAAGGVVMVGAVRTLTPLGPAEVAIADGLAAGRGPVPVDVPPLAAAFAAFAPVTPEVALLAASALGVVGLVRLVRRAGGTGVSGAGVTWLTVAGLAVAAVVATTGPSLGEALATLLVATGLIWLCGTYGDNPPWVCPREATVGRAVVAGLCLGGAVLARPEAVVAVPAAVTWLLSRPRSRPGRGADLATALAVVVAAGVAVAPWQRWLHAHGASPLAGWDSDPLVWAAWAGPVVVAVALAWRGQARPGPRDRLVAPRAAVGRR